MNRTLSLFVMTFLGLTGLLGGQEPVIRPIRTQDRPASVSIADGLTWTYVTLGTLGGADTRPAAINDGRVVVGASQNTDGTWRAFRWRDGGMRDLGTPGVTPSRASDIDNAGQIVGSYLDESGFFRAFLYSPSTSPPTFTIIPTLGGDTNSAEAISPNGRYVVGSSENGSFDSHAFRYDTTTDQVIDLGTLGGFQSEATGVNNQGQVVGWSQDDEGRLFGFLWDPSDGVLQALETPEEGISRAWAIDNDRHISGEVSFPSGQTRGVTWLAGGGSPPPIQTQLEPVPGFANSALKDRNYAGLGVGSSDNGYPDISATAWLSDSSAVNLDVLFPGQVLNSADDVNSLGDVVVNPLQGSEGSGAVLLVQGAVQQRHILLPRVMRRGNG